MGDVMEEAYEVMLAQAQEINKILKCLEQATGHIQIISHGESQYVHSILESGNPG